MLPQAASFALFAMQVAFLAWFAVLLVRADETSFMWLFSAFVPGAASGMFANAAQIGPTIVGKRFAAAASALLPIYAVIIALVFAFAPADLRAALVSAVCVLAVVLGMFCGILTERFISARSAQEHEAAASGGWRTEAR